MPNIWIFIVVIVASLIKGFTGFGFALISLPFLLIWYSPKEIIPVLMICNLIASSLIIFQKKEYKLIRKSSVYLIITGGLFTVFGVSVMSSVNENKLMHISGLFFIVIAVLSFLRNGKPNAKLPNYFYPIAGSIIGFITGLISVSGPPLALFLNRAKVNNQEFREIFAWFSVVTAIIAIVGYYHVEMLKLEMIKTSLIFTPILLLGSIIGKRINRNISSNRFQKINIVLTIISSAMLLLQ